MKTLILATVSAAALLAAGSAFAADPNTPTASVTQIGTGGTEANASSVIDQLGNSNKATVNQMGAKDSSSVVLQDTTGAGTARNRSYFDTASVTQSGNGARSLVVQKQTQGDSGQSTTVTQSGKNEYAFAYTSIDNPFGDTTKIEQVSKNSAHDSGNLFGVNGRSTMSGATATANYAQNLTGASLDAFATTGSGSYGATVVETGRVNTDTIIQHGSNNAALEANAADGDTSSITQYDGSMNDAAAIRRTGDADHAQAAISQYGNAESASIEQLRGGYDLASGATINQYGGSNQTARITQSGASAHHTATINQYGSSSNSFARTTQDGQNAIADTEQYGQVGFALTEQHDLFATANVTQRGNNDTSLIAQGESNIAGTGNTANVNQSGNNDWSKLMQNGSTNTATIGQSGKFDVSLVTQTGNNNAVDSAQSGKSAYSAIVQAGNANLATLRQ